MLVVISHVIVIVVVVVVVVITLDVLAPKRYIEDSSM